MLEIPVPGLSAAEVTIEATSGAVTVSTLDGWAFDAELDLLENAEGPMESFFGPFQVRSWRLRR